MEAITPLKAPDSVMADTTGAFRIKAEYLTTFFSARKARILRLFFLSQVLSAAPHADQRVLHVWGKPPNSLLAIPQFCNHPQLSKMLNPRSLSFCEDKSAHPRDFTDLETTFVAALI